MTYTVLRLIYTGLIAAAAWATVHSLVAIELTRTVPTVDGLHAAIRWDPQAPEPRFELGLRLRDDLAAYDIDASIASLNAAVRLNPRNWRTVLELARTYELAGRNDQAERTYRRALQLNPRSGPFHWRFANFLLREGRLDDAVEAMARAVSFSPKELESALRSLWAAGADYDTLSRVATSDSASRLVLMRFAVENRADLKAGEIAALDTEWIHYLASADPAPTVRDGLFYIHDLLARGLFAEARRQWALLTSAAGIEDAEYAAERNDLFNGGFEFAATGSALDWHMPAQGSAAMTRVQGEGIDQSTALRIDFQGDQNIDLRSPYQRVWLAPGLRYRLELQVRFEDLTTDQGPYFEVVPERGGQPVATTPMLSGSSVWESIAAEFRAPEEQEPLLVRLRRLPSQRIDSLIQGTLWIDDVRLAQTSAEAAAVMTANYGKGEQASAGHP